MNPTRTRSLTFLLGLTVLLAASVSMAATDSPSESAQPAADPAAEGAVATAELDSQLFTPAPQQMGQCITCVGYYVTDTHWGAGANCNEALADLQAQTTASARAHCQSFGGFISHPCNTQLLPDQCWFKQMTGEWIYDGRLAYGCLEGDYFCPEW